MASAPLDDLIRWGIVILDRVSQEYTVNANMNCLREQLVRNTMGQKLNTYVIWTGGIYKLVLVLSPVGSAGWRPAELG